ncbi:S-adenosyl-L-methionine-dependent methyltransferase [Gyrodon lividus]|nr:S-adenosyl-L-methionine-dependent methyltransferase [Gyrodon lividus]
MSFSFLFRRGFSTTAKRCRPRNIPDSVLLDLETSIEKVKPTRRQRSVIADESSPHAPALVLNTRGCYKKKEKPRYVSDNRFYLPLDHEWHGAFPTAGHVVKHHACLRNAETAAQVAEAFVPAGTKNKVIVEAFPGPGVLTRALMQLPKERIDKIIVLENSECFLDFLRPLQEADPRVRVLPWDGYAWGTYYNLEAEGHLNEVEVSPWQDPNPQLQFIAHLPTSIYGEQLIAQLLRLVPDRGWLFRYGRVPMSYVMHDWVWERISADTSKLKNRCKLSVIAEAVTAYREVVSSTTLEPYETHFWPPSLAATESRSRSKRQSTKMVAVTMNPLLEQTIEKGMLDKWDFCLRKLFVLKSNPLKRAIPHLAPGASTLLGMLEGASLPEDRHRMDISKAVREMEVEDWAAVVRAFHAWPFAPDDLLVTDTFSRDDRL